MTQTPGVARCLPRLRRVGSAVCATSHSLYTCRRCNLAQIASRLHLTRLRQVLCSPVGPLPCLPISLAGGELSAPERADLLQTSRPRAAAHHRGAPAASHSHTAAVRVRVRARGAPPCRTPRASRASCLARLAPRAPRPSHATRLRTARLARLASHALRLARSRSSRLAPRMHRAPAAAPPSRPCGARAAAPRLVAAPLLALLPRRHRVGAALLRRRRRRPPSRRCRGGDLAAPAAAPRS